MALSLSAGGPVLQPGAPNNGTLAIGPPAGPGAGGIGPPLGVGAGGSVLGGSALASPQAPGYLPPSDLTGRTFTGHAPTATPYGDFTGPDPAAVANDPYYQFRAKEGEQAIQRSAASHGTLLNGGTLKSLEGYRQGLASEEAGKAFDRALSSYTTNRDTNAQNFGENNTQFHGDLDVFNANNNSALDWAKQTAAAKAASSADSSSSSSGGSFDSSASQWSTPGQPGYGSGILPFDSYAASVQSARALNAAESDRLRRPLAATGSLSRPVFG